MTMESVKNTTTLLVVILIFSIFVQINGKPNYLIIVHQANCTVNPAYADPPTCYFNSSANPPFGYFDIQMHREVKNQQYEMNIDITVNKRKRNLLHLKKSACAFFEGRVTAILKMFKNIMDDYGELPKKCPVDKNFRYLFKDVSVDSNRLPVLMPEADFHITTKNTENNELIFFAELRGNIRRNEDANNFDTIKI